MATKAKPATEKEEVVKKTVATAAPKAEAKVTSIETPKTAAPKAAPKKKELTLEQVRQKAYEIFLKTGNHNEHENWIQAEKTLLK